MPCGKCCKNIALVRSGRPIRSLHRFKRLQKKVPFYRLLEFDRQDPEDGLVYFRCTKLGEDGLCTDHENRPAECRAYPDPRMFRHGARLLEGCSYKVEYDDTFGNVLGAELDRHRLPIYGD